VCPSKKIDELNLLIAGVGGQGIILAATVLANAAVKKGIKVRAADTFGAAQRGGAVLSHIRIGSEVYGPLVPKGRCDILLGFEPVEALRVGGKYLSPESYVIINTKPIFSVDVTTGKASYPTIEKIIESLKDLTKEVVTIEATNLAIRAGNVVSTNVVMLGGLSASGRFPLAMEDIKASIIEIIPMNKHEMNLKAFEFGAEAVKEKLRTPKPRETLK